EIGNEPQPSAVRLAAVAEFHFRPARGVRGVAQVFDEDLAPVETLLEAHAGLAFGRSCRHSGAAGRHLVHREALEPARDEDVDAPPRTDVELEPRALGMQIDVLALVEIEGKDVEPQALAAIRRLLDAQRSEEHTSELQSR